MVIIGLRKLWCVFLAIILYELPLQKGVIHESNLRRLGFLFLIIMLLCNTLFLR